MFEPEQFWFGLGIMVVVALTLLTVLAIRLLFISLTRRRDQRHERLVRARQLLRAAAADQPWDPPKRAGNNRSNSDADRRHT
jgi:hypothetical protein